MDFQLAEKIAMVPLRDLKESPKQQHIHADFDPAGKDKWFVENIRRNGILVPLIVLPDKTVKEGHRRMWAARLVGKTEAPCALFTGGDADAIMFSAILHRQVSLYTKCIAYREKIEALASAGKTNRAEKLVAARKGTAPTSGPDVDQAWIEVEQALDVRRDHLQVGVGLLKKIEALEAARRPEERDRAKRIAAIFRNRGLKPALRMIDERTSDEVAEDLAAEAPADDTTPDMNQWETGPAKREPRGRNKHAPQPKAARQKPISPFTPPKTILVGVYRLIEIYDQFFSGAVTDRAAVEKLRWEPAVAEWVDRVHKLVNKPEEATNGNTVLDSQTTVQPAAREPVAAGDVQALAS